MGWYVAENYVNQTGDHTPAVILATASPYKFSESVVRSLEGAEAVKDMDAFQCAKRLEELSGVAIPKQISELSSLPIRHKTVCEVDGMEEAVLAELNK